MAKMPRPQKVMAPILRNDPRLAGVKILTWIPDIDYRTFPMINLRRIGGIRNPEAPTLHALPIIEMTAYTSIVSTSADRGIAECEELYETALDVLYDAVEDQIVTPAGSIQSIKETMGATQFSSPYQDSWRIQGLIRIGIRPPRTT